MRAKRDITPGKVNTFRNNPISILDDTMYNAAMDISIESKSLMLSDENRDYLELLIDIADALGIDDLSFSR